MTISYRIILIFLGLTACLYPLGLWLLVRLQTASPLMFSVGLAAIGACLICRRSPRSLGWGWGSWKYHWISYLIPLAYCSIAYVAIWWLGLGNWYDQSFIDALRSGYQVDNWTDGAIIAFRFAVTATVSFALILPGVLGEEIGWRGLLVPELSKSLSFSQVCLISGIIWAVWHWPLMLLGFYKNPEVSIGYQMTCFSLCIVSMSVVMTYIRYQTGSLWPAVILHMSHNAFLQKFFTPITESTSNSAWFVDEFGIALPLMAGIIAVIFWRKGVQKFDRPKKQPDHTDRQIPQYSPR
ncbi:type II CAAX endopeptidase family protein [Microbulbifer sp. SAOS-129_SWC]|uniref:CPBP family intramembrane glutamic endopeptidase n=1 Tax=Microbulbifer sp. SAOS-129_SWC TaxID=3145235 RepID=UPI0032169C67